MRQLGILFLVILLVGCNNDDDQPTPQPSFEPIEIEFTEIGRGTPSPFGEDGFPESFLVIEDSDTWENLLDSIGPITNSFNQTEIDFDA
jgi:hypothetical protein